MNMWPLALYDSFIMGVSLRVAVSRKRQAASDCYTVVTFLFSIFHKQINGKQKYRIIRLKQNCDMAWLGTTRGDLTGKISFYFL